MSELTTEYFEGKELENLISAVNWHEFLPILYALTRNMMFKRFLVDADRGVFGKTYKDFVHDALAAFFEGKRKCPKTIKIEYFFWQTLRNMISKHIGKHYNTVSIDASEEDILMAHYSAINTTYDFLNLKNHVLAKIESDEVCKTIFECWTEGIDKPSDIRELYGYSASDYNSGRKRLMIVFKNLRNELKNER